MLIGVLAVIVSFIAGLVAIQGLGGYNAVAVGLRSCFFWIVLAFALNALRDIAINSWWQADLLDRIRKASEPEQD